MSKIILNHPEVHPISRQFSTNPVSTWQNFQETIGNYSIFPRRVWLGQATLYQSSRSYCTRSNAILFKAGGIIEQSLLSHSKKQIFTENSTSKLLNRREKLKKRKGAKTSRGHLLE